MDTLINLLRVIETNPDIKKQKETIFPRHLPDIEKASYLASSILISPYGDIIWDHVEMLRSVGFPVFAIEKDSMGWLVGGIQLLNGILAFG